MTKQEKKQTRQAMILLKKQGKDYEHLAICPDSYQIYLSIKHEYNKK